MTDVTSPRTKEQILADQATIKAKMHETYKHIQVAVKRSGSDVFKNVNRGLAGEPNRFYAFENEILIGTPFNQTDVMQMIIDQMMQNGAKYFCVLVEPAKMEGN